MKLKVLLIAAFFVLFNNANNGQCSRQDVINDYNNVFLTSSVSNTQLAWTGDFTSCTAGTISALAHFGMYMISFS